MRYFTTLLAASLLLASAFTTDANSATAPGGRIKVSATILPLADMVRQVGGNRVQVVTLLPPGVAPFRYHPTPAQIRQIRGTALQVRVGNGFDSWGAGLPGNAAAPPLTLVVLDLIGPAQHDRGNVPQTERESGDDTGDPWAWLDPLVVRDRILPAVRTALTRLHPGDARYFKVNERRYFEELTRLDQSMRSVFQRLPGKGFLATHDVWGGVARRYGVQQAASIESRTGSAPTQQRLDRLAEDAQKSGIVAVFGDPWSKVSPARQLAGQIQGFFLLLDPLGGEQLPGRQSYLALMNYNMVLIMNGIKQAEDAAD